MNSTLKRALGLAALISLLAVPLTLLLSRTIGGLVYDLVAVPILYLAWMGRLYLRIVPPVFLWGALLLFALTLVFANVLVARGKRPRSHVPYQQGGETGSPGRGPISRLAGQIRYAAQSTYFRADVAQRLGRLTLQILDYPEDQHWSEIQQRLDALDAPPEVRDFLNAGQGPLSRHRRGGLIAWLRGWLRRDPGTDDPHHDLEQTVQYLENHLEGL